MKIKLFDENLIGQPGLSRYIDPKTNWEREPENYDVGIYVDRMCFVSPRDESKTNCAWLIEPPIINGENYINIVKNKENFKYIFTHHKNVLPQAENAVYIPHGGTWMREEDINIHDKSKIVSCIFSWKNWNPYHRMRFRVYDRLKDDNRVDFYGTGCEKPIEYKTEALKDYMFSIVIENSIESDYFTEKILFIDPCRFSYQPVAWARDTPLTQLPALTNGFITFASFNNTAKLNENVLSLWAKILLAVPNSKLVLKWRTFIDVNFSDSIREFFIQQGIPSARLDLQAASFHQDLFKAYSQIDIALDPFPFSGGLTSCEALWMGLPVITWPQNRIVSRQTYSFLSTIGLTETVASNETEYIQFAVNLANNLSHLAKIRQTLRQTMLKSKLLDIASFTQQIEQLYIQVFDELFAKSG